MTNAIEVQNFRTSMVPFQQRLQEFAPGASFVVCEIDGRAGLTAYVPDQGTAENLTKRLNAKKAEKDQLAGFVRSTIIRPAVRSDKGVFERHALD